MTAWLVFVVAGVGTFLLRASFVLLGPRVTLPARLERVLPYVGPAVFAAIVAPPVLGQGGLSAAPDRVPEIAAVAIAGAVAWRTGRVIWVLVIGMAVLWILRALGL